MNFEFMTIDSAIVRNRMYQKIEQTTLRDPHPGLIIALHDFKEPYPLILTYSVLQPWIS